MSRLLNAVVLVALCTATGSAFQNRPWPPSVAPAAADAPVRSPADEMATFAMPPGYHVELVASEPLVQDVVAIDWDPDGRMWAIEMAGYMHDITATDELEPSGRIVVLEDTNNDGRMDKRTVFMDGLVLPRALKVLDHGVLIGEPPYVWLARDNDGDLKADSRVQVTDKYGRRDANVEHNANAFYWALDNWMYTSETDVDLRLTTDGTFIVRPTLSRGQWGVSQDDAGRIYRNTNESSLHVDLVPARYFMRNPTLLRTRGLYESLEGPGREANRVWPAHATPGVNRGYQAGVLKPDGSLANFTSVSSPTVFRGDRLPRDVYGDVFVTEPAANLVARLTVKDDGTTLQGAKAYQGAEFLTSTDERFRPVNLSAAPDGTLYIVDIYRGIIQHKGFITEYLRYQILSRNLEAPIARGRIYRVVYDGIAPGPRPALSRATPAQLVATLTHPNGWWRDTAQRLLVERKPAAAVAPLRALARSSPIDHVRLQALWTLDGMDRLEPADVTRALGDSSRDVRTGAVRMSEKWLNDAAQPAVLAALHARETDADWAVQRQLAATFGELSSTDARLTALAGMLERRGDDPVTVDVVISGLRGLETDMLTRLLAQRVETPQSSAAITMLAGTVVRGGRDANVQTLLGWVADAQKPAWQRAALLNGAEVALLNAPMPGTPRPAAQAAAAAPAPCPTCPGGRAGPGGASAFPAGGARAAAPAPRPSGPMLRLSKEPAAVVALAGAGDPLSTRLTAVLAKVEWPGKPGASAPLTPLTAEEQRRFDAGHEIYTSICQACHQQDGRGAPGVAASLVGSQLALGPAEVTARILLQGKEGTVSLMPALGTTLSDEQIASVLTYVRREWGQGGTPVDPSSVRAAREASAGRTRPWTNEELLGLAAPAAGAEGR
jgi:mono/diheme cytochrome c family protein/glucose/arabinose dehydrogenase